MKEPDNPRCCRCHAHLTYNEQHHYGLSCDHCELDYSYVLDGVKNYDYWKRFTGYTLRCLRHGIGRGRDALLRRLLELLRNGRRRGF